MIFGREPFVITNALILLATAIASVYSNDINIDFTGATPVVLAIITAAGTLLARRKAASQHTVNKAGLTMDELVERAEDPRIPPAVD